MQQQQNMSDAYFQAAAAAAANNVNGNNMMFPTEVMPWNLPHGFNPVHFQTNPVLDHHDPFLLPPQPPSSSHYGGGAFNRSRSSLSFPNNNNYDIIGSSSDHLRFLSDTVVLGNMGQVPFGLQAELGKLTAQEMMDAKALAASKSHSEAERRRRERINNHLAKLRSLLPSTTKTDKASLLAEVIQHVKELKRQTSIIAESTPVPTEIDELTVDNEADEDGRFIIKASICCEDRNDLLPDLIKTLKAMRLRTLKAEITTLGGRVKNVLFITGDDQESNGGGDEDDQQAHHEYSISSIQEALKAVMEKSNGEVSPGSVKRQRTNIHVI